MHGLLRMTVRLNANIERYQITLSDGVNTLRRIITARNVRLCFSACSPCIRVVATPLTEGYSTILYTWINGSCQTAFDLYFNFPAAATPPAPTPALNGFTLTDSVYGLPIDGNLTFTST